jgi:hypothetical protein
MHFALPAPCSILRVDVSDNHPMLITGSAVSRSFLHELTEASVIRPPRNLRLAVIRDKANEGGIPKSKRATFLS